MTDSNEASLQSQTTGAPASGSKSEDEASLGTDHGKPPVSVPWWIRAIPFAMSAFFFLSGFFAIFSPLPLILMNLRWGRKWALLGTLTNAALVAVAGGLFSLGLYGVFILSLSWALAEALRRVRKIEIAGLWGWLSIVAAALLLALGYAQFRSVNPWIEFQSHLSTLVQYLGQSMPSGNGMSGAELEEWKQNILVEFPSAVAIFSMVLVWASLVVVVRANPNGLRERLGLDPAFTRKWKAPEFLIWPTIASFSLVLVDFGVASDVGLNVFKFLMAIYAIQGLSILAFFLDAWGLRGPFRWAAYVISVFLMLPLLLSLGFFDLWFDFRAKFRQS